MKILRVGLVMWMCILVVGVTYAWACNPEAFCNEWCEDKGGCEDVEYEGGQSWEVYCGNGEHATIVCGV